MEKTINFKTPNGMTVNTQVRKVTGFGTKLNDGTYLTVEIRGGSSFPVHPEDRRKVWNSFLPFEEGGKDE